MRVKLSIAVVTMSLFIGCGSSSSSTTDSSTTETTTAIEEVHLLKPQEGTQSYLFYGEVNPKALGDITNVRVFDPQNMDSIIVQNDDTTMWMTLPYPQHELQCFRWNL